MTAMADLAFAGITLLLIIHSVKWLSYHKRGCKPPGPLAWPIIGHIHLLNSNRPLHQALCDLARRYGHVMLLKLGSRTTLVVSSWELARECLTIHDMNFASRPRSAAAEHLGYDCMLLGLDPYDDRCRNLRRICTSQLLSASRVESSQHIRREEVSKLVRGLFQSCTQMGIQDEASTVVDMRSIMVDLIFDTIVRSILPDKSYMGSAGEAEEFKEMIDTHLKLVQAFNVSDYIPYLGWLDLHGCEREMKKFSRRRDEILQRVTDKCRLPMKERDESLIDVLIHFVDKTQDNNTIVKATIASLIIAGTDTTAITTEWAMASLLQCPEMLKKAQEELDIVVGRQRVLDESDLPNLKYLGAIVKETLRLYPAAPLLLPHMAAEPCTVGGYYVPGGTELLLNAWGIHRDPAAWERPLDFEPERFMKSSSPDINGRDFKYLPFGCGRRACPGMRVAMRMLKLTVGRLVQSFDWSVPQGVEGVDMSEERGLTLHKAVPLKAAIEPRLPHHLY